MLGLHVPFERYYIDGDAVVYGIVDHRFHSAENDALAKLRGAFGWRFEPDVALFAGASLIGEFAFSGKDGTEMSVLGSSKFEGSGSVVRLGPGLFAGVHVE